MRERRDHERPHRKPAYAMERVADPAPPLASTTSSPPNWTPNPCLVDRHLQKAGDERLIKGASFSAGILTAGFARLKRGTMVSPE